MQTHNIHDAKTQLSRLVELAASGETIIIAKAGKPMAKLVPIEEQRAPIIGALAGMGSLDMEASEALDEDVAALFSGQE